VAACAGKQTDRQRVADQRRAICQHHSPVARSSPTAADRRRAAVGRSVPRYRGNRRRSHHGTVRHLRRRPGALPLSAGHVSRASQPHDLHRRCRQSDGRSWPSGM